MPTDEDLRSSIFLFIVGLDLWTMFQVCFEGSFNSIVTSFNIGSAGSILLGLAKDGIPDICFAEQNFWFYIIFLIFHLQFLSAESKLNPILRSDQKYWRGLMVVMMVIRKIIASLDWINDQIDLAWLLNPMMYAELNRNSLLTLILFGLFWDLNFFCIMNQDFNTSDILHRGCQFSLMGCSICTCTWR